MGTYQGKAIELQKGGTMEDSRIRELISNMTLEEKAGLLSGKDFWHTKPVERLGIPSMMVSDGPHGLRKQVDDENAGFNESIEAICFPAGCAAASSFDTDTMNMIGKAIGHECQAEDVGVILGPAVNIKRSPLCGRNFEYYSEDPYLAGKLAAAFINGVQSEGVGTSIKHFAANSQEKERMSISSELSERALREIYLPAFETAVKESKPWTVMCSYNKVNGTYSAENSWLLNTVLRDEWGFDGFVVSDWGAVNDRAKDVAAGLDLEMPGSDGINDALIVKAVKDGKLDEKAADKAAENILRIVFRYLESRKEGIAFDKEKDHEIARRAAEDSIILLSNSGILPLDSRKKIAFIGGFASKPRFQGGGSSHIKAYKADNALEAAAEYNVIFSQGFDAETGRSDEKMLGDAVRIAKNADIIVLFLGLPDTYESEGYDRSHMRLPDDENRLFDALYEVNRNIVVVLSNGSPVEMPWKDKAEAIVESYLAGEASGKAVVDILFGKANPSGHLAETFPIRLEDTPSYLFYGGELGKASYAEGIFVGYRYYDKKKMDVLFPFGHGLSYTTFSYSNLKVTSTGNNTFSVSVDVENTGNMDGKASVQLYVRNPETGSMIRPVRELRDFAKVSLKTGEEKTVSFSLPERAFTYFDEETRKFETESGIYGIEIGDSSRNILLSHDVEITATKKPGKINADTIISDILADDIGKEALSDVLKSVSLTGGGDSSSLGEGTDEMMRQMLSSLPLHAIISFSGGKADMQTVERIIEKVNAGRC